MTTIYHSEGRVIVGTSGAMQYEYVLKDHLGSGRVWFSDANDDGVVDVSHANPLQDELMQEEHYYPYGLRMDGSWSGYTSAHGVDEQRQFNGVEFEQWLGWNVMPHRTYDPALGRFGQVDPLAEEFYGWSGYNFVMGNPVRMVDPSGLAPDDWFKNKKTGEVAWYKDKPSDAGDKNDEWENIGETYLHQGENGWVLHNQNEVWRTGSGKFGQSLSLSAGCHYGNDRHKNLQDNVEAQKRWLTAYLNLDHANGQHYFPGLLWGTHEEANKFGFFLEYPVNPQGYVDYSRPSPSSRYNTIGEMPWYVGGPGKGVGNVLGKSFSHSYKYHARIRTRALEDPVGHNFPYSFDDFILNTKPINQTDGSLLYRLEGTLNQNAGVFEIGLNPTTNTIFHRTFNHSKNLKNK